MDITDVECPECTCLECHIVVDHKGRRLFHCPHCDKLFDINKDNL